MRESLSNIHRHSGSKTACIQLSESEKEIRLEVSDQGRGLVREMLDRAIDNTQLGVGIAGMRERLRQLGGRLEIRSSSKGTTVIASAATPGKPAGFGPANRSLQLALYSLRSATTRKLLTPPGRQKPGAATWAVAAARRLSE
jgi:hypothetical protein